MCQRDICTNHVPFVRPDRQERVKIFFHKNTRSRTSSLKSAFLVIQTGTRFASARPGARRYCGAPLIMLHKSIHLFFLVQKKIFITKLKGHPNLFVTGKFLYSHYRNKKENAEGIEDLFLYRKFFVESVFVRTIFDCTLHSSTKG